jgi:hypothetical protein
VSLPERGTAASGERVRTATLPLLLSLLLEPGPLLGGTLAGAEERPLVVVVEPAVFVGMVEVTSDRGARGVLLSTATEEVVVANNALAEQLMDLEGEMVMVRGRLTESADGPPMILVREFHVLGRDAGDPAHAGLAGTRAGAGMRHASLLDQPRIEATGGPEP